MTVIAAPHIESAAHVGGGGGAQIGAERRSGERRGYAVAIASLEFTGPSGRGHSGRHIKHMLGGPELLQPEVRHAGLVRLLVPRHHRAFEHRLEVAPVVGADLLAAGREHAGRIAAPLQETHHAPLVIEREFGKIAPPTFGKVDLIGPPAAARIDDQSVDEGHLPAAVVRIAGDNLFAADDAGAEPASSRQKTMAHASDVSPKIAACLPLLLPKVLRKRKDAIDRFPKRIIIAT